MEDSYIVRLMRLPRRVNGFVTIDEDGLYNIYINKDLTKELQERTLKHELAHIRLNHFYLEMPTELREKEANHAAQKS